MARRPTLPTKHASVWLPDKIRYIDLFGVLYYIAWEEMEPGCSFFLKTTASAAIVSHALRLHRRWLGYNLKPLARHENGYYGVRVWRLQ